MVVMVSNFDINVRNVIQISFFKFCNMSRFLVKLSTFIVIKYIANVFSDCCNLQFSTFITLKSLCIVFFLQNV